MGWGSNFSVRLVGLEINQDVNGVNNILFQFHRWLQATNVQSWNPYLRRRLVGYVPRSDALALTAPQVEDANFPVAAGRDAHLRVVIEHARSHLCVGRRGRSLGRQVVFLGRMKFSITINLYPKF